MKQLLILLTVSIAFTGSLSSQDSIFFLKKIDLVLGGQIYLNSTDQAVLNDFVTNSIETDLTSTTTSQYETLKDSRDINFYTGVNIGKSFMIGASFRDSNSESIWNIDYGSPSSPNTYSYARDTELRSYGILMRYNIPFSAKINFSLQPFISKNHIRSVYSYSFSTAVITYEDNYNFEQFGLTTQINFQLNKRFNFLINFGRLSFLIGETSKTTISYIDGIQASVPIYDRNDINDFEANFNYTTLSIGFELVL